MLNETLSNTGNSRIQDLVLETPQLSTKCVIGKRVFGHKEWEAARQRIDWLRRVNRRDQASEMLLCMRLLNAPILKPEDTDDLFEEIRHHDYGDGFEPSGHCLLSLQWTDPNRFQQEVYYSAAHDSRMLGTFKARAEYDSAKAHLLHMCTFPKRTQPAAAKQWHDELSYTKYYNYLSPTKLAALRLVSRDELEPYDLTETWQYWDHQIDICTDDPGFDWHKLLWLAVAMRILEADDIRFEDNQLTIIPPERYEYRPSDGPLPHVASFRTQATTTLNHAQ